MDKIREEFETLTQFMENISKKLNCLPDYTGDYRHIYKQLKSRDEEINILKQTIQIICNNLKVNQKGTAIDVLGDIDVWALLDLIKESE